ncbi:hypothetical protein YC2023_044439 [Brassica napus]
MLFSDDFEKLLQSLKQMDVDRKLREELRMDSQRLHEEFREEYRKRRKRPYGESHPYNAFIPKRFEDLKLNGGTRFKRIPIKLNYHRSRFKKLKSNSPRRTIDSKGLLDRTGLATFQRRCVGMKKQYHQKKRTAQVKLAQACKSSGMFLVSPSFRDPKDCTKICVGKRQIIDTGVRPETHLLWYEFTSYEPTDIDGHVDTRIGDQSIFAEDVTALEHDDPDAAMESLKDETVMESEPEITRKCKSVIEPSQIQQKRGKQGFHKVRFKARLHRRSKASADKVTKGGEPFMMGNSESFHTGGSKCTRRLFVKWCYYKARENRKSHRRVQQELSLFSGKIKGKPPEGVSGNRREALEYEISVSENGRFNLELLDGSGTDNFSFSTCVKKQTWRLVKTFCGRQLSEICLAVQVWEPGGDSDKRVQFMKNPLEPLWSFFVDSSQCLSLLFVKWKEVPGCEGSKETKSKRWLNCDEELDPSRKLYVWDPGQIKSCVELRQDSELKEKCQFFTLPVSAVLVVDKDTSWISRYDDVRQVPMVIRNRKQTSNWSGVAGIDFEWDPGESDFVMANGLRTDHSEDVLRLLTGLGVRNNRWKKDGDVNVYVRYKRSSCSSQGCAWDPGKSIFDHLVGIQRFQSEGSQILRNVTAKRSLELCKNTTGQRSDDTSDFYVRTQHHEFRNNLSLKTRKGVNSYCEDGGAGNSLKQSNLANSLWCGTGLRFSGWFNNLLRLLDDGTTCRFVAT